VTAEIGRIFCPKCGNGGTLRKVAVTVNENGIVVAARRPRVTLRGTKVSSVCVCICYIEDMEHNRYLPYWSIFICLSVC